MSNILINLLLKPDSCESYPSFLSQNDWDIFLDNIHKNRLTAYLFHYQMCHKCRNKTNGKIGIIINYFLTELKKRRSKYLKVKQVLKKTIKNNYLEIMILKDYEEDGIEGYPNFYIPLKFDLDILGTKKDLDLIRKNILKLGYSNQKKEYGFPDKSIPQYKFKPDKNHTYFPQIEYRYKAITIHLNSKINTLNQTKINDFTKELFITMNKNREKNIKSDLELKFIHLCLIYYFEDVGKGLNNLYRIHLFLKTYQKNLDWKIIRNLTNRYKVDKVIKFVIFLTEEVFNSNHTNIIRNTSWDFRLLRKLFSNGYVSNSFYGVRSFNNEIKKDFYAYFVLSAILAEIPLWQKSLFFLHPRRLFILMRYALITST